MLGHTRSTFSTFSVTEREMKKTKKGKDLRSRRKHERCGAKKGNCSYCESNRTHKKVRGALGADEIREHKDQDN